MEIRPIIDPYSIHYDSFVGDVYTIDTASITLTAGSISAVDGTFTGDLQCDELTLTAPTAQDYKFLTDSEGSFALQGQTSGQTMRFGFYPKDGDDTDFINWRLYKLGTPAAITNYERLTIIGIPAGGNFRIMSEAGGSGTLRSLALGTGANITQLVLNPDGSTSFGGQVLTTVGSAATPGIALFSTNTGVFATGGGVRSVGLSTDGAPRMEVSVSYATFSVPIRITDNATNAFLVEQAGGTDVFNVNTTNKRIETHGTTRFDSAYSLTMEKHGTAGAYSAFLKRGTAGNIDNSSLIALCNREINGEVAIMANVAAGAAGEVEVARFADDAITLKKATTIGDGGITNYTQFAADGLQTMVGTARVIKEIIIGAGVVHKGSSSPDDVYLAGGSHVLAFDKTTTQHGHFATIIPQDFAAGTEITIEVDWSFTTEEADHYMTWELEYLLIADGEDPAGALTSTSQKSVISTGNHDKQIHTTFGTGITGAVVDDTLLIRFSRDADHATDDDLNQDAYLLAVHLHYISDKLGEAT